MHPYKNMFLIVKRSYDDPVRPGTWDLPGGNVSFGEKHRDALRREIEEETRLNVFDMKEIVVLTDFHEEPQVYYLVVGTVCRATSDRVIVGNEHTDYVWIRPEEFFAMDPTWNYQDERAVDVHSTHILRDIVYVAFNKQ